MERETPSDEQQGRTPSLGRLRVDAAVAPVGIDTARPRFTWEVRSETPGTTQRWWRITLEDDHGRVVWDSGQHDDPLPWAMPADDLDLVPLRRHRWSLTVGVVAPGDATAVLDAQAELTTGPAEDADWDSARWVGRPARRGPSGAAPGSPRARAADGSLAAPVVRHTITVVEPPVRALLVLAAGGHAVARIDGVPVSDAVLEPSTTQWDRRVQTVVHDVTALLGPGPHEVSIELGRGFHGMTNANVWSWERATWWGEPCVRALLRIERPDGGVDVLPTGRDWQVRGGPILLDDLYGGEVVDLRRGPGGPLEPRSEPVALVDGPAGRRVVRREQPVRVTETLGATSVAEPVPGEFVITFPRVVAGWVRLVPPGPAGTTVTIRYGERLRPDGLPNADDEKHYFQDGFQTDVVTGDGSARPWESTFSYKGFRYVQVSGWPTPEGPRVEDVVARVAHTDAPRISRFAVDDPLLQWIHDATLVTMENNLQGYPTDTPKYEKNGWTGDAMVGADMFLTNLDAAPVFTKWMGDLADTASPGHPPALIAPNAGFFGIDEQAPVWHSALVLVPWDLYRHTGDTAVLVEHWTTISDYARFELGRSPGGIADTILGDWVAPGTDPGGGNPPEDSHVPATAFLVRILDVTGWIAEVLGHDDDAAWFAARADEVRAAFVDAFVVRTVAPSGSGDGGEAVVRGPEDAGYRQSHAVLALAFDILRDPELVRLVADGLAADVRAKGDHLDTGAVGTKWLLPVLSDHGHVETALAIARQTSVPSWGAWREAGATSMFEHWDLAARSHGHFFLGTVDDWLTGYVAGLRPAAPGWRRILVDPRCTASVRSASFAVRTPFGPAWVAWEHEGDDLVLRVGVPVGATAEVHVPAPTTGEPRVVEVGSGEHLFVAE
ncbi:alpha-L-rhamnosidase [Curtobacterium sp. Leaf261]|uniref:alpha-L-rhamnosidase n=1 Tax=Curtobacterium sp. Leaf261 TaxID=1736311 RepID=UPI0006F8C32B|nr:alpha-L-rhamnosidase [Curtobacterium sp. Leaf261]KQO60376.1 hypothetical protein ASF23_14255 [Curtobacterium sp. Leaf261]